MRKTKLASMILIPTSIIALPCATLSCSKSKNELNAEIIPYLAWDESNVALKQIYNTDFAKNNNIESLKNQDLTKIGETDSVKNQIKNSILNCVDFRFNQANVGEQLKSKVIKIVNIFTGFRNEIVFQISVEGTFFDSNGNEHSVIKGGIVSLGGFKDKSGPSEPFKIVPINNTNESKVIIKNTGLISEYRWNENFDYIGFLKATKEFVDNNWISIFKIEAYHPEAGTISSRETNSDNESKIFISNFEDLKKTFKIVGTPVLNVNSKSVTFTLIFSPVIYNENKEEIPGKFTITVTDVDFYNEGASLLSLPSIIGISMSMGGGILLLIFLLILVIKKSSSNRLNFETIEFVPDDIKYIGKNKKRYIRGKQNYEALPNFEETQEEEHIDHQENLTQNNEEEIIQDNEEQTYDDSQYEVDE